MKRDWKSFGIRVVTTAGLLGIFLVAPAAAQDRPSVPFTVTDDPGAGALTFRMGPMSLASGAGHGMMSPKDIYLPLPFDGWLVAFYPRITDGTGSSRPGKLLHHVSFWNTTRPDFLCPNKQEYVFGSGSELNDWPRQGDLGYPVVAGDSIRIETRFHNPTGVDQPDTYLEVEMHYVLEGAATGPLTSAYPAKFNVDGCNASGYLLRAGETEQTATFGMPVSGTVQAVGGHLHDFGRALGLYDDTRDKVVARLVPELDPEGRLLRMPVVVLSPGEGHHLAVGDSLTVKAEYQIARDQLPAIAMGILIAQFVPDDDSELAVLRHR